MSAEEVTLVLKKLIFSVRYKELGELKTFSLVLDFHGCIHGLRVKLKVLVKLSHSLGL